MTRRVGVLMLGLLALACTARAAAREGEASEGTSTPPASVSAPAATLPASEPAPGWIGVVRAREAVELSSEVAGTLVAAEDVELGDAVTAGQLLAHVDAPLAAAEREAAVAALASAEAARGEAALLVADARRQSARERELVEQGASSHDARERAELALDQALAGERGASASVAERRAELERAEAALDSATLRAPFAGRVAAWHVRGGEHVDAGTRILRVAALDELWVRFAVPVDELAGIRAGVRVEVVLEPSARVIPATIRHVAPELDLASQMMFVEAELDARAATAGQACRVRLAPSP